MPGIESLDRFQRRHRVLAFPLAVRQKYSEDQGSYLAATISYYAFFALFPLLLVFVSVLGFVLHGHPRLKRSIVDSALGQFPIIGHQLTTGSLRGSALGIGLGLAGSLWAGMGVVLALQNAVDSLWGVPQNERSGFLGSRLRALVLLLALALAVILTAALGGLGTVGASLGLAWKLGAIALAVLIDFGVFWVGFRVLSGERVPWRALRGGALAAAIAYEGLQLGGGLYVHRVLEKASTTYGTFTFVIGLLSWIYLTAHIALLTIEGNVVASRHLWPRSLSQKGPITDGDRRALDQLTQTQRRRRDETIEVDFDQRHDGETSPGAVGPGRRDER